MSYSGNAVAQCSGVFRACHHGVRQCTQKQNSQAHTHTHTHFLYLLADSHLLLHLSSTCNLAAKSTEAYKKLNSMQCAICTIAACPKLFCVSADNIKIWSNVAVLAKQTPKSVPWSSHQRSHCGSLCLADLTLTRTSDGLLQRRSLRPAVATEADALPSLLDCDEVPVCGSNVQKQE